MFVGDINHSYNYKENSNKLHTSGNDKVGLLAPMKALMIVGCAPWTI